MNLHALAGPAIAAVNPPYEVEVRISTGSVTAASGDRTPAYATPGAITASIADNVLTVTAVASGVLQVGQTIAGAGVLPQTTIIALGTGSGGVGTYTVSRPQTVAEEAMTTSLSMLGQVQPVTWRDIQQMDGLNLQGIRQKIYLYGEVDGLVRPERRGGDLVIIPAGQRHAGTYLVAQVLEQFPDWVCAALTLQNGG